MRTILPVSLLFFAVACASARMTAIREPSFADYSWGHVAVHFISNDLEERTKVESKLVGLLLERGVEAVTMTEIIPPTRKITEKGMRALMKKSGLDCILVIMGTQTSAQDHQLPSNFYYNANTGSGTFVPGAGYQTYSGTSKAELIETEKWQTAWVATIKGNGRDLDGMLDEMASVIVKGLVNGGVLYSKTFSDK